MCKNRTKIILYSSISASSKQVQNEGATLTFRELILPVFLLGFHGPGVLTQHWRLCVVLATESLPKAESGQPSCARA